MRWRCAGAREERHCLAAGRPSCWTAVAEARSAACPGVSRTRCHRVRQPPTPSRTDCSTTAPPCRRCRPWRNGIGNSITMVVTTCAASSHIWPSSSTRRSTGHGVGARSPTFTCHAPSSAAASSSGLAARRTIPAAGRRPASSCRRRPGLGNSRVASTCVNRAPPQRSLDRVTSVQTRMGTTPACPVAERAGPRRPFAAAALLPVDPSPRHGRAARRCRVAVVVYRARPRRSKGGTWTGTRLTRHCSASTS